MRNALFRLTVLGLASASLLSACADETGANDAVTTASGARIIRSDSGALTAPSSEKPDAITRKFLAARGVDVAQLAEQREIADGAVTHVVYDQVASGLRVYGSYVKAALDAKGQLLQVIDATVPVTTVAKAQIDARGALTAAMTHLGYNGAAPSQASANANKTTFAKGGDFYTAPEVEAVAYVSNGVARQGYVVETWSAGNQLDYTLVGADGAIVATERRTNNDRYNVYTEDPLKGGQTIVSGPTGSRPWLGTGSQTSINITGNNVHAYLDADGNNRVDSGGTSVTNGDFLTAADLSASPSTAGNKNVAAQNLFYFNNTIHDILYTAGFTEAAGNFQTNNFGLGGAQNDAVLAEAQDGSGTDNANFSTPTDGKSPRMQMYLWTNRSTPAAYVDNGGKTYVATTAEFGPALSSLTGTLKRLNSDGCTAFASGTFSSRIAVLDRGNCDFTVKVMNAQSAGASGVVIVNNVAGAPIPMGGTERRVKIPSVMVSQGDGAALTDTTAKVYKNTNPAPMVDGDIDADIVFHEYGHGLTWRMVGSMSGPLAGAIGEGASDVNAFLVNDDPLIGEYAWQDTTVGIRRYSYEGYPLTYGDWTGAEVHDDGEIYAAAMWRVLTAYKAAGYTNDQLRADFVSGLNFTPASPAPEQMRDGLLQAVAGNATKTCAVWKAFAATGIGVGAKGTVVSSTSVSVTESFATPSTCP